MKLVEVGNNTLLSKVPFLGMGLSFLWYIIGAQDYYFYEKFRKMLNCFEKEYIDKRFNDSCADIKIKTPFYKILFCWKIPKYGVTVFAAASPLIFGITWLVLYFVIC